MPKMKKNFNILLVRLITHPEEKIHRKSVGRFSEGAADSCRKKAQIKPGAETIFKNN